MQSPADKQPKVDTKWEKIECVVSLNWFVQCSHEKMCIASLSSLDLFGTCKSNNFLYCRVFFNEKMKLHSSIEREVGRAAKYNLFFGAEWSSRHFFCKKRLSCNYLLRTSKKVNTNMRQQSEKWKACYLNKYKIQFEEEYKRHAYIIRIKSIGLSSTFVGSIKDFGK